MYFDEAKLTYLSISRYDGSEVAPRNSCCEENGSFNEIAAYKAYFDYQDWFRVLEINENATSLNELQSTCLSCTPLFCVSPTFTFCFHSDSTTSHSMRMYIACNFRCGILSNENIPQTAKTGTLTEIRGHIL